ncbi:MAG: uridine phosphorylase [Gammaproteobacteria bacterium]|jgi:uridine phosphorylase|nr:MAG: uridine phosphorylase [Gammaproteobacteria bacterium]
MEKKAWYIGCSSDQVAERVILIGDPGRVPRLSKYLDDVVLLPVNRGLATATGTHEGVRVTLAAFGMGAPIASIVLHELSELGSRIFLRIGTAMCLPPTEIGDFAIADSALRHEGTSYAYASKDFPATADEDLVSALTEAANEKGHTYHVGKFASYDGFYRDMFALDDTTATRVRCNFDALAKQGVIAVDMETSALLTVGKVLGCKTGSFCIASVNSLTRLKINSEDLIHREKKLMSAALDALTSIPIPE